MNIKRGFTFIEILVVIAVLAVLAAIVMLIINPAEYLRRARDAQRLGDAARITQAMALYTYGTASRPINQDPDGPKFPLIGSPPITDSCINDPIPHRLFVSVPNDNGETAPSAPTDWQYTQVSSTKLRAVDGNGWLPVNFTEAPSGQTPFSVLPVDPVNTFASGYYYSYGCGSWNINMNFESQKYRDEVSSVDQGRFDNVYEIGSDLAVLPEQERYNVSSTDSNPDSLTYLSPTANGYYSTNWIGSPNVGSDTYVNINDPYLSPSDSTVIKSTTAGDHRSFVLQDISDAGTITGVRVVLRADKTSFASSYAINARLYESSGVVIYTGPNTFLNTTGHTNTWTKFTSPTLTLNPSTGNPWTVSDINNLEVGVLNITTQASGFVQVSQIYLEVDHQ